MFPIPRLYLAGIGLALILALAGGLYLRGRHDAAEKAKAAVAASQQAQRQAEVTTQALDTHVARTTATDERASRAYVAVQKAPGATDAIDPDRRAILCASLASVRGTPVCDDASDDIGSPPSEMQGTDDTDADAVR